MESDSRMRYGCGSGRSSPKADTVGPEVVERALTHFRSEARLHSPIFVLHVVRNWCNALSTSFRIQGGATGCVWGCAPVTVDSLQHYMVCDALWSAIAAALGRPIPLLARVGLAWDASKADRKRRSPLLPLALAVDAAARGLVSCT